MLLPDKHITLAESIIGLGAFVLGELEEPRSVDRLYERMERAIGTSSLPAYHDYDALVVAILFLYSIGAVELRENGVLQLCAP